MKDRAKAKLIIFSGPSGGGKSTICRMLLKKYSKLAVSISSTTRKKRVGESHGKSYFFISEDEFSELLDRGEMLEWAEVHGNRYGTRKETVDRFIEEGRLVLFDIDVQGMQSIRKVYSDNILSIFLKVPSEEELVSRLRSRATDSEEKIKERVKNARKEIESASMFNYTVLNNNLEETFEEICGILEKELKIHGKY